MSALKEQINQEMKTALLGGDRFRGDVLRSLKAVILNEEVALGKRDQGLEDAEIEKLIVKEVKKRQESLELYKQNGRDDLAENEQNELNVLQEYLPEQLSEQEVEKIVAEIISEMGDVSGQQMGQVIGAVKAKVGSAADGAVIAKVVKQALSK